MKITYKILVCILLATGFTSNLHAQACSTPHNITQWISSGPNNSLGFFTTLPVPAPPSCVPAVAIVDGQFGVHVYSVDINGHLIESFQQTVGGGWQIIDITMRTGVSIAGIPSPLHLQNTVADIQIYATDPNGDLLAFVTTNNTFSYQVFDITALSGGSTVLGNPAAFQVGSTVHVFATDISLDLHDFYKPLTTNWLDIDLTQVYGGRPGQVPQPFFYGGNSIQIVAVGGFVGGNLECFIEGVNSDGTINSFPFAGDLTAMAGGTALTSAPRPLVVGPGLADVAIFGDDTGGNLVEYFKAPTSLWTERNTTSPRPVVTGATPSALFFPNASTDRAVKVFSRTDTSHLFEYVLNPVTGVQTESGDLTFATGVSTSSDPYAITLLNVIEVFTLNN